MPYCQQHAARWERVAPGSNSSLSLRRGARDPRPHQLRGGARSHCQRASTALATEPNRTIEGDGDAVTAEGLEIETGRE